MQYTDPRPTIHKGDYDVIVVGGGVAGVAAAVAAARGGAKTVILEKSVAFGGLATIGLISFYEPLCDCYGKQMIAGIPEELLQLSIQYGFDDMSNQWKNGSKDSSGAYATHYSPSIFAMALDQYLADNNVSIRVDALATYPVMVENHCKGIVVETVSGKEYFGGKIIIDATGSAAVFQTAGAPCVDGTNFLTAIAHGFDYERAEAYIETKDANKLSKWFWVGSDLAGNGQGNLKMYDGTKSDEVVEFMLTTRKMVFDGVIRDTDRNLRDISRIPMMPDFRTIRHIVGEYAFSGEDENVVFEDSVGSCADFRSKATFKRPKHYHIPYSCMYNKAYDNLLAAGRIVDCDREGWEITRVIPVAALTGEAAGTAAAIAAKDNKAVYDIDIKVLQKTLKENGVLFEI